MGIRIVTFMRRGRVVLYVTGVGLLACALLFGGSVIAEDGVPATIQPGMTPSHFFYFFDLLAERIQEVFIFDPGEKFSFYLQLSLERTAEMEAVARARGRQSKEYEMAAGLRLDHLDGMKNVFLKEAEQKNAVQQKVYEPYLEELRAQEREREQARSDVWGLEVKKKELREEIATARDSGDKPRVEELLGALKEVKAEYDRLVIILDRVRTSDEIAAEQIEDLFDAEEKAQLIIERAEHAKQAIREEAIRRGITLSARTFSALDTLIEQAGGEGERAKEWREERKKLATLTQTLTKELADTWQQLEEQTKPPEEAALDRKQVEERAVRRKQTQPAEPAREQAPPTLQPVKQPEPRPLGQPKAETLADPITFNPLLNFQGTVGETFEYSYCQPPVARVSDLCTAASIDPTGGQPPYHFELGSGGFPPFGMTLNLNGLMKGTPTAEGTRTFSVCAVDLAGMSACRAVTFTVNPEEEIEDKKEETWTPRTGCPPQSDVPKPSSGCSYEILKCDADTSWVWEYRFACPEQSPPPPARDCGVQPMNTCEDQCTVTYEWSQSVDPACSEPCNADFTKRAREWTECMY